MRNDDLLFSRLDLRQTLQKQKAQLEKEVEQAGANELLNVSVDDFCAYLAGKYAIEPITLRENEIAMDQGETDIDISRDFNYAVRDRSTPSYIKGTEVTIFIPFEGEKELFQCQPSTFNTAPPRGDVRGSQLLLRFRSRNHDATSMKCEIESAVGNVRSYVEWVRNDVEAVNRDLPTHARRTVEARREKLRKDQGLAVSLGIPMRRRDDAPATFSVPDVRRKPKIPRPKASAAPFVPEPTLAMEEYEHILGILRGMSHTFERSPSHFRAIEEEHLRSLFLAQLNGHYEGRATGETFNSKGKTDILIRENDRNVFIAECKFWEGPKAFAGAIDQLLGYATWRDAKLALLLFNRRKDFSAVLKKMRAAVKGHPNFKREEASSIAEETEIRAILHRTDDENRELLLTILAFDFPEGD